jgi:hypothetical protein
MYNKSIVDAEKLDLETRLKEEMIKEFNNIKEKLNALIISSFNLVSKSSFSASTIDLLYIVTKYS